MVDVTAVSSATSDGRPTTRHDAAPVRNMAVDPARVFLGTSGSFGPPTAFPTTAAAAASPNAET